MTDYHDFTTKDTPREERRLLNVGDIWVNSVECLKCGDSPRSVNRHDCRPCNCGAVAVDGGSFYSRVLGDPGSWVSRVETFSDVDTEEDDE